MRNVHPCDDKYPFRNSFVNQNTVSLPHRGSGFLFELHSAKLALRFAPGNRPVRLIPSFALCSIELKCPRVTLTIRFPFPIGEAVLIRIEEVFRNGGEDAACHIRAQE
jgi:hypothetical protein